MASPLCRQENSPLRACALAPSCSRSTWSDSSRSIAVDQSVVIVDQHAGDAVDDRIDQASGRPVTDRGHRVLGGLDHRQRPAFLPRRQNVNPGPLQDIVFGVVVDMPVEGHRIGDTAQLGVVDQMLLPPPTAENVQVHVRDPGA